MIGYLFGGIPSSAWNPPGTFDEATTPLLAEVPVEATLDDEAASFSEVYGQGVERWLDQGFGGTRAQRSALVSQLADAEAAEVGTRGESGVRRVARREDAVISRLLERRAEAVAAALVLHHDLFLEHRRAHRAWLEHLSLERVRDLASRVSALDGSSDGSSDGSASSLAADVLTSLGGYLQAQGRVAGRGYFELAIALDPGHEAARLALAIDYEKRGGPWPVILEHLEELLAWRPQSREGRLRLAINLERQASEPGALDRDGQLEVAQRHLLTLIEDGEAGEADWIESLAAAELARMAVASGRLADAEELLRAAWSRRPGDQQLGLQLAYVLDRLRRPEASRQVLERLRFAVMRSPGFADQEPSPRERYNRWSGRPLEVVRERFESPGESPPGGHP